MSWIHKLYETYEAVQGNALFDGEGRRPLPVGHIFAKAHVEVTLNAAGEFTTARVLDKAESQTCIPCTEDSGSRSGRQPQPHPLADKLQYVAGDFRAFGGEVTIGFQGDPAQPHKDYVAGLRQWCEAFRHPKLEAILSYVEKGCLITDLKRSPGILPFDRADKLVASATKEEKELWPIWKAVGQNSAPQDAVIRWRVELAGDPDSGTWDDSDLMQGWSDYYLATLGTAGTCSVSGEIVPLTGKHPRGIRNSADGAKLISSNDKNGFTFRGRFTEGGAQAIAVGYEVSQKVHNTLRWLIANQGRTTRHGDQVFVAWAVSGKNIPTPFDELEDWKEWNDDEVPELETEQVRAVPDHTRDLGQSYARKLNEYMVGYGEIDAPTEDIVIMGLNSASPGRMAITYYRELKGSEFLERLRRWHMAMAWPQRFGRRRTDAKGKSKTVDWLPAAPAPDAIVTAAYGHYVDDKLHKSTVERLIPCIIDGRPLPRDLMESCARRVICRAGDKSDKRKKLEEWEKVLGVACALFKGFYETHPDQRERKSYAMTLEATRTSRDYLFGRLLAIAENIEQQALYYAGENRPTNAERLMQHFAERPSSGWRTLELALDPYLKRLQSRSPGFLKIRKDLLDDVVGLFRHDDFIDDGRLSTEFLLGYHCQRLDLRYKPNGENPTDAEGDGCDLSAT